MNDFRCAVDADNRLGETRRPFVRRADQRRHRPKFLERLPLGDPFGNVGEVKPFSGAQSRKPFENRPAISFRRSGNDRASNQDQRTAAKILANHGAGAFKSAVIRRAGGIDRKPDRQDNYVRFANRGGPVRRYPVRSAFALFPKNFTNRPTVEFFRLRRPSAFQVRGNFLIRVDADHRRAVHGKTQRQRQSNVSLPDNGNMKGLVHAFSSIRGTDKPSHPAADKRYDHLLRA